MKLLLTGFALVMAVTLSAQQATPERLAELRAELEAMHETDQAQRQQMTKVGNEHGQNSPEMTALWAKQTASDQHNIKRLEEIIAEIGWPKRSAVGERAASAAFLILQHSDLAYQKKYLADQKIEGQLQKFLEGFVAFARAARQGAVAAGA